MEVSLPEPVAPKPPAVPPLPDWLAPALSVGLLGLLLLHLGGKVTVDTTALALIGLILLSWLLPLLSKLKVGGVEIELRERVAALEQETEAIVDAAAAPDHEVELFRTDTTAPTLREVLARGPYTFRSLSALSRATRLNPAEIEAELSAMVSSGLAVMVLGKGKRKLWGLTARGRSQP